MSEIKTVTVQIPVAEYGTIATLAAVDGKPIDKYVISQICKTTTKPDKTT